MARSNEITFSEANTLPMPPRALAAVLRWMIDMTVENALIEKTKHKNVKKAR